MYCMHSAFAIQSVITLNGCIQSKALPLITFYIWDIPTCIYMLIKLVINILTMYDHTEVYPTLFY